MQTVWRDLEPNLRAIDAWDEAYRHNLVPSLLS
jgi:hypothetical protein